MANQTELLNVSDGMRLNEKGQIIERQEHDEELCFSSSDTTEELYSSSAPDTCGDRLFDIAQSPSLSGVQGFHSELYYGKDLENEFKNDNDISGIQ